MRWRQTGKMHGTHGIAKRWLVLTARQFRRGQRAGGRAARPFDSLRAMPTAAMPRTAAWFGVILVIAALAAVSSLSGEWPELAVRQCAAKPCDAHRQTAAQRCSEIIKQRNLLICTPMAHGHCVHFSVLTAIKIWHSGCATNSSVGTHPMRSYRCRGLRAGCRMGDQHERRAFSARSGDE
jgi:hypothetical protein